MTTTTRHPIAKRVVTVQLGPTSSASTPVSSRISLPAEPWPQDASYQPRDETKPRSLPIRAAIDPDAARRRITNDLGLRRYGA